MNRTEAQKAHAKIKQEYPDVIVFLRVDDFMETYGDDAEIACKELELAGLPGICDFPYHAIDRYTARLVQKGFRVAHCNPLPTKRGKGN